MKRRNILKLLGTTTAISGTAGVATAEEKTTEDVITTYMNESQRERVFSANADILLKELGNQGILNSTDVSALNTSDFLTEVRGFDSNTSAEGTAVTLVKEHGETYPLVMSAVQARDHIVRVYVKPESRESYALIFDRTTGDEFAIETVSLGSNSERTTNELVKTNSSSCSDYAECGDRCWEGKDNCYYGNGRFYKYNQYSCYYDSGLDHCSCYIESSECGVGECYETCTG